VSSAVILTVHIDGGKHGSIVGVLDHQAWVGISAFEVDGLENPHKLLPPLACSLHKLIHRALRRRQQLLLLPPMPLGRFM